MTLEEARGLIGHQVVSLGWKVETGVVTSVNDRYVFVRFDPKHEYGQACSAEQLLAIVGGQP